MEPGRKRDEEGPDAGPPAEARGPLRALTYLAPGIPLELFERVTQALEAALGRAVCLESEGRISGPMHGESDPFGEGRADLGFLCAPSYLYLRSLQHPSVHLVPAAFAFRNERARGRAVYFSEVVVRADHAAEAFDDLAHASWGYNDSCSLSGYFAALQRLGERGLDESFFDRVVCTGSHDASLAAILAGDIDCATIDSTVLARARRERPELVRGLRVIDSLGPFPVQPIVLASRLGESLASRIADVLLELHRDPAARAWMESFELERFVPNAEEAYAEERRALCALGRIESSPASERSKRSASPPSAALED